MKILLADVILSLLTAFRNLFVTSNIIAGKILMSIRRMILYKNRHYFCTVCDCEKMLEYSAIINPFVLDSA